MHEETGWLFVVPFFASTAGIEDIVWGERVLRRLLWRSK